MTTSIVLKMEDDLNLLKMEDDLNKTKIKWKTNQSTKINLIGSDTFVNSPSQCYYVSVLYQTPAKLFIICPHSHTFVNLIKSSWIHSFPYYLIIRATENILVIKLICTRISKVDKSLSTLISMAVGGPWYRSRQALNTLNILVHMYWIVQILNSTYFNINAL